MQRNEFIKCCLGCAGMTLLRMHPSVAAVRERKIPVTLHLRCVGCGDCVRNCPVSVIRLRKGKAVINTDECIGCLLCINICSFGALR